MSRPRDYIPRTEQTGVGNSAFGSPFWTLAPAPNSEDDTLGFISIQTNASLTFIFNFDVAGQFDGHNGYWVPPVQHYTSAGQSKFFRITIPTNRTTTHDNLSVRAHMVLTQEVNGAEYFPGFNTDYTTILEPLGTDDAWQLTEAGTYDLVIDIDYNTLVTSTSGGADIPMGQRSYQQIMQGTGGWDGRMGIQITQIANAIGGDGGFYRVSYDDTWASWATSPIIDVHGGWENQRVGTGRPILDMRSGLPAFAEDMVEDGYYDGIWTAAENVDQPDPRWSDRGLNQFPENEGVKKDEVPA